MTLFKNSDCACKRILFILCMLCFTLPSYSQVFEYHPSFALSSGLGFTNNMANETSFLLRNEFVIKDTGISSFCPIVGIGYSSRTYKLQYQTPGIDYFSGPVYMDAAVLEVSLLIRLTSWRKLRKTMIPFLGFNTFRFLSKSTSTEEENFWGRVDSSYSGGIKNYRSPHTYFSIETGMEFVKNGWPRLCLSILWELPIPTEYGIGNPDSVFYFRHSSMFCPRFVVGIRL